MKRLIAEVKVKRWGMAPEFACRCMLQAFSARCGLLSAELEDAKKRRGSATLLDCRMSHVARRGFSKSSTGMALKEEQAGVLTDSKFGKWAALSLDCKLVFFSCT
jgi:hypothetical protein